MICVGTVLLMSSVFLKAAFNLEGKICMRFKQLVQVGG